MREGHIEDPNIAHAMALEENKGRNQEPRGPIVRGLSSAREKVFGNEKLEEAQAKAEQVGEKLETEKELAKESRKLIDNFYTRLQKAGNENNVYNILNGEPDTSLGPIETYKINKGTSIVVGFNNSKLMKGRVDMIQLSVDMNKPGEEIYFFQAPYGPVKYFNIDQQDEALRVVTNYVRTYRLYPGSRVA